MANQQNQGAVLPLTSSLSRSTVMCVPSHDARDKTRSVFGVVFGHSWSLGVSLAHPALCLYLPLSFPTIALRRANCPTTNHDILAMGFFKRFFSIGSKKSRRRHQDRHEERVDANGRIVQTAEPWQQADRDATRLLRSSSAHFSVVSEVDYSTMPPLRESSPLHFRGFNLWTNICPAHPVNNVAQTPVATPAKSEASVQRRGTYTVRVLERKLESRTEFPNANPPFNSKEKPTLLEESPLAKRSKSHSLPFTPRDQSRLLRLRQDPSVASLLDMYDEKGQISSDRKSVV